MYSMGQYSYGRLCTCSTNDVFEGSIIPAVVSGVGHLKGEITRTDLGHPKTYAQIVQRGGDAIHTFVAKKYSKVALQANGII